jgi:FkbM family methyltransferase
MSTHYRNCIQLASQYLSKNSVMIDVGCNINPIVEMGYAEWIEGWNDDFTLLFLEYFPESKCIGIEPLHWQTYENRWINDSRVELLKIGLSDKDTIESIFFPGERHVLSSFYFRNDFKNYSNITVKEIKCKKLDSLFIDFNLDKIDYLKIDTEGSEYKILCGATELLKKKKINFIQYEYGLSDTDSNIPSPEKISNFLKSFDYEEILTSGGEKLWKLK